VHLAGFRGRAIRAPRISADDSREPAAAGRARAPHPNRARMYLGFLLPDDWRFYGNPAGAWIVALSILAATVAVMLVGRRVLVGRLGKWAARTATDLDDLVVDLVRRTRLYFIVMVGVIAGSLALALPAATRQGLRTAMVVALCLQAIVWGNGVIQFWVDRYTVRRVNVDGATATTVNALGYLARFVFWIVILLLALDNFGVDVTTLVTGLGITGIAVALAVQNILGDLLGALSIVVDKPFVVGDAITVDQFTGTVEHIGLKTTRVRSLSGEQIVFSNADLLKARIRNHKRLVERRVLFVNGVSYETPREKLERIPAMLRDIVLAQQPVRFDRSHLRSFGESAIEFETVYYVLTDDYNRYMDIQQAVNLEILRRFEQEEIQFAFPTRTIIYKVDAPPSLAHLAQAALADER
jgi:small-conductance mechanosensitive channel